MKNEIFFTCIITCIITHIVRSVYEILKHKKILRPGKLSFAIILINMILLWISWFLLCRFDIYRIEISPVIRYAGISLTVIGVALFLTALLTIRSLENYDGELITSGIYSRVRHPMYLGFILWLISFPVCTGAVLSLVLSVIFIANVLFWRYLEELELIKRYPAYQEYSKSTIF